MLNSCTLINLVWGISLIFSHRDLSKRLVVSSKNHLSRRSLGANPARAYQLGICVVHRVHYLSNSWINVHNKQHTIVSSECEILFVRFFVKLTNRQGRIYVLSNVLSIIVIEFYVVTGVTVGTRKRYLTVYTLYSIHYTSRSWELRNAEPMENRHKETKLI